MINTNNIADLFNFIQNHKKNNSLIIKITKNKIKIVKNKKNADLIINNKYITVNKNIDLILRQCCEIIIPLLLKNNCNFIGQIGQSLDGKIALNNGNSHYINEKVSLKQTLENITGDIYNLLAKRRSKLSRRISFRAKSLNNL